MKKTKKLVLNRETLHALKHEETAQVHGGTVICETFTCSNAPATCWPVCYTTC